ncbi:hypothetical protein [Bacillus altitudinis]|uniref:hypothetical protein n=1 Tax=Bacillus altitudinis TaxID=293387 RepID=UPI00110D323F|nr:hypothetical protein [Bacillus altitudinis]MBR0630027.1 hypothetical protein [Bacillus altitudinis S70-5-12]MBU8855713.1 hypothetical protein [Bacillus sp. FJAT-26377]
MAQKDHYKNLLKRLCEDQGISTRKPRFEQVENLILINLKNQLKEGVDLECFRVVNLIHQTVSPFGIKFDQQLTLYPGGDRLDRVTISFDKDDYDLLNNKLETGDF